MDRQGSTCFRQERTKRLKTLALSMWYIGVETVSSESSLCSICAMAECRALVSCLTERRDCDCVCGVGVCGVCVCVCVGGHKHRLSTIALLLHKY